MNRLTTLAGVLAFVTVHCAYAERSAQFPSELLSTAINEGTATVAWTVAPDGRIEDTVVLEATHPAFARSALEAAPKRLPPDFKASLPRYESVTFVFKRRSVITGYSSTAEMHWQKERDLRDPGPTVTVAADELSQPLRQTGAVAKVCPDSRSMIEGAATVRFVIDDEGRVRVPRVVNATSDEFAQAMLSVVRKWHFSPPSIDGKSVQVEDTQLFNVRPTQACVVFKPTEQTQVARR